ncbi:MAG: hypothetical protein M1823_006835, partial [Watsoniomyces obsoletus]
MFFFGPESERPVQEIREPVLRPTSSHRPISPDSAALRVPPKHGRETGPNGIGETTPQPASKRSRKATSTGPERNGARKSSAPPLAPPGSAPMEVDLINGQASSAPEAHSRAASEGVEEHTTLANGVPQDDHMDVDTDGELQPDLATEVVPPPVTLTNGPSVGVQ